MKYVKLTDLDEYDIEVLNLEDMCNPCENCDCNYRDGDEPFSCPMEDR